MDPSKQEAKILPSNNKGSSSLADKVKSAFQPHTAHPGPVQPKTFDAPEEGTKEERRAKAQELNKET
ncbi:hypothetical protein MAPG_02260 [Magnaporthiopsis poae ATCC 64411]|uniref:Uncharacterized protein n=1 Tax=Magnaporthiopsis poae (strain ATCC 64411 / 73-15) TaxID=644358 RepID=A0A0C4DQW2_MAGP6|nr:hypothetical protein MAPG_02260 [Magnaporthiopsis poae ATCC 64411]